MGHLERLSKYSSISVENLDALKGKLRSIKEEIAQEWFTYKRSRAILHGENIQDDQLDMLLVYLIKKGIL